MLKAKKITGDLLYSVTAVGIMNIVLQFVVYPVINNKIGVDAFGEMLFFLGIVNVLAPSFGIAVNNTRLLLPDRDKAQNRDFLFVLFLFSIIAAVVGVIASFIRGNAVFGIIGFIYIILATMFRNYSCVDYRLDLNYKKQFVFYMILSVGYLAGLLLFLPTKRWELVFILGETAAVLFVVFRGHIYSKLKTFSEKRPMIIKNSFTLAANYIITNMMLNLDRIVLLNLVNEAAVSKYYVLSLMGKTISIISGPLNGILIGYLTKEEDRISKKGFLKVGGIMLAVGAFFLAACMIATPIFIRIMYPDLYQDVIALNFIVNLAQIIYFLSGILVVITLTVSTPKRVLGAQITYSVVFIILSVLLTSKMDIRGFAYAAIISNVLYFAIIYIVGFLSAKPKK